MKRLFTFIALAAITFSLSAQTKVAYCDVYVRGGGQNLRVTVMYDHNVNYYDRTNMGNILNAFAADGWALDSEIVIPRFHWWSWCTRHKLHLIMKKEYQTGENPFKNLKSLNLSRTSTSMDDSYNQNKSTYGFSTSQKKDNNLSLYGVYDGYSVIVELSQDGKHGKAIRTYDYAASYKSTLRKCQELGDSWRLPTEDELIEIFRNRESINKALKRNIREEIYFNISYWLPEATPTTINSKTLEKKQRGNSYTSYFILIKEF